MARADKFMADLLSCITDYRLFPMIATLLVSEWNKLNKDERIFLTGGRYQITERKWLNLGAPNKTYFLPFQFCVIYPARACAEHLKVNYFFDLNKQFKNYTTELFALMKSDTKTKCRPRIGDLTLLTSEQAPGLQAADLLAYETYQYTKMRVNNPSAAQLTHTFKEATRNRKWKEFPYLDKYGLQLLLWNCPAHLRRLTPEDAMQDAHETAICKHCSKKIRIEMAEFWAKGGQDVSCGLCHGASDYRPEDFRSCSAPLQTRHMGPCLK